MVYLTRFCNIELLSTLGWVVEVPKVLNGLGPYIEAVTLASLMVASAYPIPITTSLNVHKIQMRES